MQYYTHSHIAKPFLPKQGLYVACGIENQHFISPPPMCRSIVPVA